MTNALHLARTKGHHVSESVTPRKIRTHTLRDFKKEGRAITMLTSYDTLSASIFDEAGIDVLLVGDSAGNTVLGYDSTVYTKHEDIVRFTGAVARSCERPLVLADLAFGTYQVSVEEAVRHGVELMQAGAQAVKLEGGREVLPQVEALVRAGIPVCGHLGFTPQSVNQLGGFKVQGRGEKADALLADAVALQEAGAFAVVLELVPAPLAARVTDTLDVPTIGIGAGAGCDGQVLVWQDMAGLSGFKPRFVKAFADLRSNLMRAACEYGDAVRAGEFPSPEHTFEK